MRTRFPGRVLSPILAAKAPSMKPALLPLLLLALTLFIGTGCQKEDGPAPTVTLNYDGPNASAPQLQGGLNTYAAYFPPAEVSTYTGRTLERITFYLTQAPLATSVVVYDEGPDDRTPGAELYRRDLTARITTTGWIEHRLVDQVVPITGRGIWLAVEVELEAGSPFAVGCDAGRTYNPNGDLLRPGLATQYASFNDLTGETVNWNIRGILAAE